MEEILISAGGAALAGGLYGLISYFKNKKQEEAFKGFNLTAFLVTVCGSAAIGGAAAYSGVSPDIVANSAVGPLVYQTLRKVFKTLLG